MGWAWSVDSPGLGGLCERRIDRRVLAAAFIRAEQKPRPPEYAIALSDDGNLWWLEIRPGQGVGGWTGRIALSDEVVEIHRRRRGRWRLELCNRHHGRLYQAVVFGHGAERFALALEEFAVRQTVRTCN
jgi:hypothetical protein